MPDIRLAAAVGAALIAGTAGSRLAVGLTTATNRRRPHGSGQTGADTATQLPRDGAHELRGPRASRFQHGAATLRRRQPLRPKHSGAGTDLRDEVVDRRPIEPGPEQTGGADAVDDVWRPHEPHSARGDDAVVGPAPDLADGPLTTAVAPEHGTPAPGAPDEPRASHPPAASPIATELEPLPRGAPDDSAFHPLVPAMIGLDLQVPGHGAPDEWVAFQPPAPATIAPEAGAPAPTATDAREAPRSAPIAISDQERQRRLDRAVNALRDRDPELSAAVVLTRKQRSVAIGLAGATLIAGVISLNFTLICFTALSTALYVVSLAFRLKLFRLSLSKSLTIKVSEDDARALPASQLPNYTVMVPAFHEPEVVSTLIESVGRLDYPVEKLQILLLLEEDDDLTVGAALATPGVERFEIVLVPAAQPRTKPKALNYGLQFATGEFITIFDVEDRPDPLQLRKAVLAMREAGPEVACLQAELAYFNPRQNVITRWFTIEYLMWFTQLLPGLSYLDAPVPLGGTSNHFRKELLDDLAGWDPFNVTEDADLGVRLHRRGYRTGVLGSTTLEEANSDFVNWIKQRSRWYKGYVQTWLVHMRHPKRLKEELGWRGFGRFNTFVAGTPFIALINPIFWTMTAIWFIGHPAIIQAIFPSVVFYTAVICWLGGNFVCVYVLILCAAEFSRKDLFIAAVLSPLYWVMMSLAAFKAFIQLVFQPAYWEKTTHGLAARPGSPEPVQAGLSA
jgi:cellulose synthase/poly-beta-1,6-N-acetylglucosamine synthase-like glycosyltransferase